MSAGVDEPEGGGGNELKPVKTAQDAELKTLKARHAEEVKALKATHKAATDAIEAKRAAAIAEKQSELVRLRGEAVLVDLTNSEELVVLVSSSSSSSSADADAGDWDVRGRRGIPLVQRDHGRDHVRPTCRRRRRRR